MQRDNFVVNLHAAFNFIVNILIQCRAPSASKTNTVKTTNSMVHVDKECRYARHILERNSQQCHLIRQRKKLEIP